ncbi:hypothetical protein [Anoxybacillus gonensis]|uniref:hypothetical protein n=1 Tax=Anoxybacillus gonensis TaxID=198467 RepID=UPI003D768E8D
MRISYEKFKTKEEKLIQRMLDGESKIQLFSFKDNKSITAIGDIQIRNIGILLLAHVTKEKKSCCGKIGHKKIAISTDEKDIGLHIFIDRRENNENVFYINNNDEEYYKYSSSNDWLDPEDFLLIYFETHDFAQLTLLGNMCEQKISEITAKGNKIPNLRMISLSLLRFMFPGNKNDFSMKQQ